MGFASVSRKIRRRIAEPIDGNGPIAITPRWSMHTGVTPGDIAIDQSVMYEPATAATSPQAYLNENLLDFEVVIFGMRASADLKVTTGGTDALAQLTLTNVTGGNLAGWRITGDVGGGGTHNFKTIWGGTVVTTVPAITETAWHRVGFEIIPDENIVRGYFNPTAGSTGEAANAGLILQGEIAFNPVPAATTPFHVGINFSNAAVTNPPAGANFNGLNDLLIELFEGPPFTAVFPGGSFFNVPENDPYTLYKSEFTLFKALTQARLI